MNQPDKLTVRNILSSYDLYEVWSDSNGNDVNVQILFKVIDFSIDHVVDDKNYAGEVTYEIDTEYGGGPVEITTTYAVVEGQLNIEEDLIDTNELDWDLIDSELELEYEDEEQEEEFLN